MSAVGLDRIPAGATSLRLGRIVGEKLILCEGVRFTKKREAVGVVLRRAALSGRVELGAEIIDHFADVMDDDGSIVETVTLDAKSYAALKNHWMRCRVARP